MKQTILYIILLVFLSLDVFGQSYFSRTLSIEEGNPSGLHVEERGENFLIVGGTVLNGNEIGVLFECDTLGNKISEFTFLEIDFGGSSWIQYEDYYYVAGSVNNVLSNKILLYKLNLDMDILWIKEYSTFGIDALNLCLAVSDDFLYLGSYDDFELEIAGYRETNIMKIDTSGNLVWSKNYGEGKVLTDFWLLKPTLDNQIVMTNTYWKLPAGSGDKFASLTKLSTEGDTIWSKELNSSGYAGLPNLVGVLNDSSYAVTYHLEKDNFSDPLWVDYPYPPLIYIIDKNGEVIDSSIIVTGAVQPLSVNSVCESKNDYFFLTGNFFDLDQQTTENRGSFGWLAKLDYNGDTIWTRRIQDQSFLNSFHWIRDVHELENGDLVAVGSVFDIDNSKSYIWLLKLNSEGCVEEDDCGQQLVITSQNEITLDKAQIEIYPNPSADMIFINTDSHYFEEIYILDSTGQIMTHQEVSSHRFSMSVSGLPLGVYQLLFLDKEGNSYVRSLVIHK